MPLQSRAVPSTASERDPTPQGEPRSKRPLTQTEERAADAVPQQMANSLHIASSRPSGPPVSATMSSAPVTRTPLAHNFEGMSKGLCRRNEPAEHVEEGESLEIFPFLPLFLSCLNQHTHSLFFFITDPRQLILLAYRCRKRGKIISSQGGTISPVGNDSFCLCLPPQLRCSALPVSLPKPPMPFLRPPAESSPATTEARGLSVANPPPILSATGRASENVATALAQYRRELAAREEHAGSFNATPSSSQKQAGSAHPASSAPVQANGSSPKFSLTPSTLPPTVRSAAAAAVAAAAETPAYARPTVASLEAMRGELPPASDVEPQTAPALPRGLHVRVALLAKNPALLLIFIFLDLYYIFIPWLRWMPSA